MLPYSALRRAVFLCSTRRWTALRALRRMAAWRARCMQSLSGTLKDYT